jgi:hypothetical protein
LLEQFKRENGLIEDKFQSGWYKSNNGCLKFFETPVSAYGVDSLKSWDKLGGDYNLYSKHFKWTRATCQEVKDALIKHWEKDNEAFECYNWHQDDRCGMEGMLYGWNKLDIDSEMKPLFDKGKWFPIEKPVKHKSCDMIDAFYYSLGGNKLFGIDFGQPEKDSKIIEELKNYGWKYVPKTSKSPLEQIFNPNAVRDFNIALEELERAVANVDYHPETKIAPIKAIIEIKMQLEKLKQPPIDKVEVIIKNNLADLLVQSLEMGQGVNRKKRAIETEIANTIKTLNALNQ